MASLEPADTAPQPLLEIPGGGQGGDENGNYWRRASYPHMDANDEYYSLEPDILQEGGRGTITSSVWNLCNTILGAGTLTYPFSFRHAGWTLGIAMLCTVAFLTWYSFNILTQCAAMTGEYSYKQLGTKAYGPKMGVVSLLVIIFAAFGSMIAYNVLISDFAIPLLTLVFNDDPPSFLVHKSFIIGIIAAFVLLPLSLLKDLHRLRHTSLVAICAVAYTVIALVIRFGQEGTASEPAPVVAEGSQFFLSVPLITMSFGAQVNMLRIYKELRWNLKSAMPRVINFSTIICCVVYISVGLIGVFTFGEATQSNVLKNFGTKDVIITIARVGFLFTIMFSYPLVHFAFRMTLYELVYNVGTPPKWHHIIITTINVTISAIIAILAPSVGVVFGFSGSIIGSALIFILPGLFHIRLTPGATFSKRKLPSVALVIIGVVFGLCGFTVTLLKTVGVKLG